MNLSDLIEDSQEWARRHGTNGYQREAAARIRALCKALVETLSDREHLRATGREQYSDGYASGKRAGSRDAETRAAEAERALHREQDKTRALAAKIERVEALAESLMEQGDHHVTGCMGQADCARCVYADLTAALADPKEA